MSNDEYWDVVVVGCGFAGAVAAIAAADAGCSVLILEKTAQPGGISVCSAGGIRVADNEDAAFEYLRASNAGTTPDDVLQTLARGMARIDTFVEDLATAEGFTVERTSSRGNYPFPGNEAFAFLTVAQASEAEGNTGSQLNRSWIKGSSDGLALFEMLHRALRRRSITLRCNTKAERLVTDSKGAVVGVTMCNGATICTSGVRGGVILACGGFEADPSMQQHYWQGMTAKSAAFAGNTGDGIRMAQAAGADLWHMWHFHGSYGIRHPDPAYPFSIRTRRFPDWMPGEAGRADVQLPWILVDQRGQRFMNEYEPYLQDTGARPFSVFDPVSQTFPRIPAFLVADDSGRQRHPFGRPTFHSPDVRFTWGDNNDAAILSGVLRAADSVSALAAMLSVPEANLQRTVDDWNEACERAADADFGRPCASMMPLKTPPFYVAEIEPLVNNTQGGPVHDAMQRVLDPFGAPIEGLYAAGELGSVFGHLYISGGNIAECFIGGRIAGQAAAAMAKSCERI